MSEYLIESRIIQRQDKNLLETSLNFKIDLMNTFKFRQDFNNLAKIIIFFIKENYKNVFFEIKNNLNYLTTLSKITQLENIYEGIVQDHKLSIFFESIHKYLVISFKKNKDLCFRIIKGLISEKFDIPVNCWMQYLDIVFDLPEKNLIFDLIGIINIQPFKPIFWRSLFIKFYNDKFINIDELLRIIDIVSSNKKEYISSLSKGNIIDDKHKLTLDFYDEIFQIYFDEFVNNVKILDFDKTLKLLRTFLDNNEELEIHQDKFKTLLYNISEVYPSKFNYIESVLSLIKNRIKPETLNGLCDYYCKKNDSFSIAKLAKFIKEELNYIPVEELTIISYMNSIDITVNNDEREDVNNNIKFDLCVELEKDKSELNNKNQENENNDSLDLSEYEIISGEKDDF